MSDDFFAPPAFKPTEALQGLKRTLRDLRTLTERGNGFELKGVPVVTLVADDKAIAAALVKRPSRGGSPEWDRFALAASADVRKFADELKKRIARWTDEER